MRGLASRASGLEWLYLGIGLVLVYHHRWQFDDAYIYYRYVDNFLFLDAGLTYNAGEFVEGYTSPLHCLFLVALRSLHLSYPTISVVMGLALFAVFWGLLVELGRSLGADRRYAPVLNFPLAFMATNYSVTSFFTSGNEGALIHVAAAATALLIARPTSRWLMLIVAASPLVRPELALSLAVTMAYVWWRSRRFPALLVLLSGLVNGGWLLFRVYYYADLLPNTFYLKQVGANFESGWRYLLDTTAPYHLGSVLVFFALLTALLANRSRRVENAVVPLGLGSRVAMLAIALGIGLYVVRSGGSAMHYYYLAAPFTLTLCALSGLLETAVAELKRSTDYRYADRLALSAMVVATLLGLTLYPSKLDQNPAIGPAMMLEEPSQSVITDPAHFRNTPLSRDAWPKISDMRAFAPELHSTGYRDWLGIGGCSLIYVRFEFRSVHGYGLTDAILARVDAPEKRRGHKPRLRKLALDVGRLQQQARAIDRGMYREAVERRKAPAWIVRNLKTIELIERKIYNRHDLGENLRLALSFPPKILLLRYDDAHSP